MTDFKFRIRLPQSLHYLFSKMLVGVGQILFIRVLTSALSPVEIGKYYLVMSVVSITLLSMINPVAIFVSRHFLGWCRENVGWLMVKRFGYYLICVGILLFLVLFSLKSLGWGQELFAFDHLYLLIPALVVVSSVSTYPQELLNILGRSRVFIVLTNMEVWGKIGVVSLSAIVLLPVAANILSSIMLWAMLLSLFSVYVLYKSMEGKSCPDINFSWESVRGVFRFAWPFSIATGLYWCQTDGYRFVIGEIVGLDTVGRFVVAFSVGTTLMVAIDTLFHQLYLPVFYKEISVDNAEKHVDAWNRYAEKVALIFVPVGMCVACAGPYISFWMLHRAYWDVGEYAAFGAISQMFRVFSGAIVNGIIATKMTGDLVLPSVLGAVIALAGTYFFASNNPIVCTGVFLLLSYVAVSIGMYFKLRSRMDVRIPFVAISKALIYVTPICIILVVAHIAGYSTLLLPNIFVLSITGLYMINLQWKLSRDIWFSK